MVENNVSFEMAFYFITVWWIKQIMFHTGICGGIMVLLGI